MTVTAMATSTASLSPQLLSRHSFMVATTSTQLQSRHRVVTTRVAIASDLTAVLSSEIREGTPYMRFRGKETVTNMVESRRLHSTFSCWGRSCHFHEPNNRGRRRNEFSQVGTAHKLSTGFAKHTNAVFFSISPSKSRFKVEISNAAPSFDHCNTGVTMEDYDMFNDFDQPVNLKNTIRDRTTGMTGRLKINGHLWQEGEIEERAKDLGDFLEQLKEFQVKLEGMIEQRDKETVVALVRANHKSLMEQLDQGNKGLEQAAMLQILVQLSMTLQDVKVVPQMLEEMKDILVNMEMHEPFLDVFLEHMGSVYLVLGNKGEAVSCYKKSLEIQESIVGQDSPQLVGTLLGLAGIYTEPEERLKGKVIYNRIISILENSKGTNCNDLGVPLLHLGYIFLEEKKLEEAELYIRRVLNIAEKNNGKGGSIGVATCGLARVRYMKGDYAKAAELYQSGLSMLKESNYWSNGHLALENIRMEAAEFFSAVGRTREAQDLWEEVLHDKERAVGVNSPRLVVHLQNLATSYAQDGRYEMCEPLLRRSLKLVSTSLGPTAPQVSIPLEYLATTLHHLDQNREAESLARQALSIRERNFPDDHLLIGEACNILASILHENRKNSESLKFAWRALHIKEKHLGKNSKELAWILDLLLELSDTLGKTEDTVSLMKRLEGLLGKPKNLAP